ncbi:MAG: type III pantothenate kinase [Thermomicrobiales bacterium]|nr:type III pantothenate kinase [Thermomicrobiales bacterium]MCO5221145.1 type III pantothenate kinase [Thermomicrobiales bacterium]
MFLAIDVGNTNVHIGLSADLSSPWTRTFRFSSARDRTADEWHALLDAHFEHLSCRDCQITMCSVVPAITQSLTEYVRQRFETQPLVVSANLPLGIDVATDQPFETGTDRLTNAVAVDARYGRPAIMVDFGTATKVDALDRNGRFLGGAIATGLGVSMDALASRASRLYAVPIEIPRNAIGRNTTSAIQAGVVLGHLKMVEGLVDMARDELGGCETVILTGGNGALFANHSTALGPYEPNLTLDGLRVITRRQQAVSEI